MDAFEYLFRASALVVPWAIGSDKPVSRFSLETGFFNNFSPIRTRFSKFSFVAMSTDESFPVNVSSCIQKENEEKVSAFHGYLSVVYHPAFAHFFPYDVVHAHPSHVSYRKTIDKINDTFFSILYRAQSLGDLQTF